MKNKILVVMCSGMFAISAFSIADEYKETETQATAVELTQEKSAFDHSQGVYNNNANIALRAKTLVDKKKETNELGNKKVLEEQDAKNELANMDALNESKPYDKQLTFSF